MADLSSAGWYVDPFGQSERRYWSSLVVVKDCSTPLRCGRQNLMNSLVITLRHQLELLFDSRLLFAFHLAPGLDMILLSAKPAPELAGSSLVNSWDLLESTSTVA